ncbi:MAG: histone deacetylase family protein [Gemmataceae bacterium]|nr:histone deacetylase family protein [Gemmata sp.]MDW8199043.1 histone deacetylase family protein [Gemmataceae bacterium]
MRVITNPRQADHAPTVEVDGGEVIPAYEVPLRYAAIRTALATAGGFTFEEPPATTEPPLTAVHQADYVAYLQQASAEAGGAGNGPMPHRWPSVFPFGPHPRALGPRALRGRFCYDTYTPILPGTYSAAFAGATAASYAAHLLACSQERNVYVLTRPPGHHAEADRCGGYCYFNNAAVAAAILARFGPVAILDVDVHHGNGTQHIFYEQPNVLTVSIHGDPRGLYPFFSGYADETGTGRGLGTNLNLPLPLGSGVPEYRDALAQALVAIERFRPEFFIVALGTDAHESDPIGGMHLPTTYFREMGANLRHLQRPTLIVQEGGYNLEVVGPCVVEFLRGIEG